MIVPLPRPGYHFTAPAGHVNDPLGITWHDSPDGRRYELFVQHNPDAPEWAVACRWAQTSSRDLVHWGPVTTALAPGPGEAGCWSGSVVVEDDGTPVIAYTRVREGSLGVGSVVLARGGRSWTGWVAEAEPVLAGPPTDDVVQFRDPFLLRDRDGWAMVVGGGRADGTAAAWLYRSPDLRSWRYEGVLAERASTAPGLPTGTAWECVQLVPVDGAWVLVVSVWDGDPGYVAAAVGDFDGARFTARRWQRLSATDLPYATTTFRDAAGRPCLLSWLREPGTAGAGWAGVLSLPWTVRVVDDRVVLAPHPDVELLRGDAVADLRAPGGTELLAPFLDLAVDAPGDGVLEVHGRDELVLTVRVADGAAQLRPAGGRPVGLAVAPGTGPPAVRLLLDGRLLEVGSSAGEHAALRLLGDGPVRLVVPSGAHGTRVVATAMPGGR